MLIVYFVRFHKINMDFVVFRLAPVALISLMPCLLLEIISFHPVLSNFVPFHYKTDEMDYQVRVVPICVLIITVLIVMQINPIYLPEIIWLVG